MAELPTAIGNAVLVYPGLRRWIGGSVKQPFSVLVGAERLDFGLVSTDFFEAQTWPTGPNFDDTSRSHSQRNRETVVVYPFF
jgi:hypothetical protein